MTPTGQTADGTWQLGVRRTRALAPEEAWSVLLSACEADPAVGSERSRTDGVVARFDYSVDGWERPGCLQIRVLPAASGTTLAVHLEGLPDGAARETLLARWTAVLEAV